MVHLRPSISDNLDVLGEELVAKLDYPGQWRAFGDMVAVTYETEECRELVEQVSIQAHTGAAREAQTVFFLARSPDAPSTTMMVSSFNSMVLNWKAIVSRGVQTIRSDFA